MRRGSRREDAGRGAGIAPTPAAIVVAAGRGERARTSSSDTLKQLRVIAGKPAAAWAIEVLAASGCAPIVVALPPDGMDASASLLGISNVAFVAGGETRQDSVWNALETLSEERILIHDGARPCISTELVHSVVAALEDADAVVPVLEVDDTLKEVVDDRVHSTVDRTRIRRVQTPQGFRSESLRAAHESARADGFIGTDDAQLVERIGGRVVTVEGRWENLKLTRPDDFTIAEMFLNR